MRGFGARSLSRFRNRSGVSDPGGPGGSSALGALCSTPDAVSCDNPHEVRHRFEVRITDSSDTDDDPMGDPVTRDAEVLRVLSEEFRADMSAPRLSRFYLAFATLDAARRAMEALGPCALTGPGHGPIVLPSLRGDSFIGSAESVGTMIGLERGGQRHITAPNASGEFLVVGERTMAVSALAIAALRDELEGLAAACGEGSSFVGWEVRVSNKRIS